MGRNPVSACSSLNYLYCLRSSAFRIFPEHGLGKSEIKCICFGIINFVIVSQQTVVNFFSAVGQAG
jgi:hypothetical protein